VNRMSRKYDVPYWFVPHGILDPWVMQYGTVAKKLFFKAGGRRFLDEASTVICSTSSERDKARSQFDLPAAEVIPWPVELVDCSNRINRRDQLRRELAIPKEAKVLLYFGRLHSMKKPIETIRAVASGGDENLHLMIVGNEQDVSLKDCYAAADELGIAEQLHLIGPVYGEKKYDYLLAADAYISLSHRENFNHTAAESLSAGLPLILSPGNDLQGDIESERCSWGLCDNEPKAASEAIEAFNSVSFEELAEMGNRGRDWVGRNLQFSTFAERIQSVANKYGKII
jgi:glycosyltransferase involved in cell wall biosynthesis